MAWTLQVLCGIETGNLSEFGSVDASASASSSASRTGGYHLAFTNASDASARHNFAGGYIGSQKTLKLRYAFKFGSTPAGDWTMVFFSGSGYIQLNASRQIRVVGWDSASSPAKGSTSLPANRWHYLDLFVVEESSPGANDGILQLKINGVTEISLSDIGGGFFVTFNVIEFRGTWQGTWAYDDIVVASESARITTPEFFGDGGVEALRPNADSTVEAPEVAGEWANLDDDPPNDTAGTSDHQLDTQLSSLWQVTSPDAFDRIPTAVNAIQVTGRILTSGGTGQAQYLRSYKSGGTAENSADLNATTSVAYYRFTPTTQPSSVADLQTWEIGIAQDATANEDPIATELYLMVDYAASGGGIFPTDVGSSVGPDDNGTRGHFGPFISSAGNVYVLGSILDSTYHIRVHKAIDPTIGFNVVDAANEPTLGGDSSVYGHQVGDVLHIVGSGTSTGHVCYYHTFDMSTDTWGTTDTVVNTPTNVPNNPRMRVVVRSNGDVVVIYNGDEENVSAVDRQRVYYRINTGGGFGSETQVDDGGENDYRLQSVAVDADDNVHIVVRRWNGTQEDLLHKRLNTSGSLSAFGTIQSAAQGNSSWDMPPGVPTVEKGGTAKVCFWFPSDVLAKVWGRHVTDTTIGPARQYSSTNYYTTSTYFPVASGGDGQRAYCHWPVNSVADMNWNFADYDGYKAEGRAGSTNWNTNQLYCHGAVYTRNGQKVFAYVGKGGDGNIYYDETSLTNTPQHLIGFETGDTTEVTSLTGGTVQGTTVRSGNYAIQSPDALRRDFSATYVSAVARFAIRFSSLPASATAIFAFYNNIATPSVRAYLELRPDGNIQVLSNGATTQVGTRTLSVDTWHVIEFLAIKGGGSTAYAAFKVDGVFDVAAGNGSWTDGLDLCVFGPGATALGTCYYDDIRIDGGTNGAFNVEWIGDGRIEALRPNASGDESNWSNTFANVDDDPKDDGTYMQAPASGSTPLLLNLQDTATFQEAPSAINHAKVYGRLLYSAGVGGGGTERQAPDAILASSNLSGAVTDIDDDPDSPDGLWLTAPGNNNNTSVRVSFPTPSGSLSTGTAAQEFKAWVRKTNHSTDPSAVIELYENGSLISSSGSTTVSSISGQMLTYTWDAAGRTASLIECRVVGSVGGGSPSNRASVEVGAIEWNADLAGTPTARSYYLRSKKLLRVAENSSALSGVSTSAALFVFTPTTQPATTADVDSWQAGADQSAAGGDVARLTELYYMVDYAPPGAVAASATKAAYLKALESLNSTKAAFLQAHESTSDIQNAYLNAIDALSATITAYLAALEAQQQTQSAYTRAAELAAQTQQAMLVANEADSATLPSYLASLEAAAQAQAAFLQGIVGDFASQAAYLAALEAAVQVQAAFAQAAEAANQTLPAYLAARSAEAASLAAYLSGAESASQSQQAYVAALQAESAALTAYLEAAGVNAVTQPAYLNGFEATTATLSSMLAAAEAQAQSQAAYLRTLESLTADQQAFLATLEAKQQALAGFLAAVEPVFSSQVSYLVTHEAAFSVLPSYLAGMEAATDSVVGFMAGRESASNSLAAYLNGTFTGQAATQPAFLAALEGVSASQAAFLAALEAATKTQSAFAAGRASAVQLQTAYTGARQAAEAAVAAYMGAAEAQTLALAGYLAAIETSILSEEAYLGAAEAAAKAQADYLAAAEAASQAQAAYLQADGTLSNSATQSAYLAAMEQLSASHAAYLAAMEAWSASSAAFVRASESTQSAVAAWLRARSTETAAFTAFLYSSEYSALSTSGFLYALSSSQAVQPSFLGGSTTHSLSVEAYLFGNSPSSAAIFAFVVGASGVVDFGKHASFDGSARATFDLGSKATFTGIYSADFT